MPNQDPVIVWEWGKEKNKWQNFDAPVSNAIEKKYQYDKTQIVALGDTSNSSEVNLDSMTITKLKGESNPIRRSLYTGSSPAALGIEWQWQDSKQMWHAYDMLTTTIIEKNQSKPTVNLQTTKCRMPCTIDYIRLQQISNRESHNSPIRRIEKKLDEKYVVQNNTSKTDTSSTSAKTELALPAPASSSFPTMPTANGFGSQGATANGFGSQGAAPNGFGSQGAAPNGFGSQGAAPNGFGSQGAAPNGFGSQGAAPNGFGSQGAAPNGFGSQGVPPNGFGSHRAAANVFGSQGATPNGFGSQGATGNAFGSQGATGYAFVSQGATANGFGSHRAASNAFGAQGATGNAFGSQGATANGFGSQGATANAFGSQGATANAYGSQGATANGFGSQGSTVNGFGSQGATANGFGSQGATANGFGSQGATANGFGSHRAASNAFGAQGATGNGFGSQVATANGFGSQGATANAFGSQGATGNVFGSQGATATAFGSHRAAANAFGSQVASSNLHIQGTVSNMEMTRIGCANAMDILQTFCELVFPLPVDEDCAICLCDLNEETDFAEGNKSAILRLNKCKHMYHEACLKKCCESETKGESLTCPKCKHVYGMIIGNCPVGEMSYSNSPQPLPGHPGAGTITLVYHIHSGIQGLEHPSPGQRYSANGFPRTCYLPDTDKGQLALRMLILAWTRRLTFTVGTSLTTNCRNSVIWNEIHHKTDSSSNHNGHGYPDPNYLDNLIKELQQQGVTEEQATTIFICN